MSDTEYGSSFWTPTPEELEEYGEQFALWNNVEERKKYEAPGYATDPHAALAYTRAKTGALLAHQFWPDEAGRNILSGADEDFSYHLNAELRSFEGPPCEDKDDGGQRISDFFTVLGSGDDPVTGEATLVIRSIDARGQVRTVPIPRSVIASGDRTLAAHCQARGFVITNSKVLRVKFQNILSALFGPRLIFPDRAGWIAKTNSFVLPTGHVIGDSEKTRIYFSAGRTREARVGQLGSFDEWKKVVTARVPGNSRFELALCAAFVSPLMEFHKRVQPTMLNIYGESTRGKSISGFLFGSVWGGSQDDRLGFAHSWNQTENSTMALAAAHSGIGLALDELKLCAKPGRIGYVFSEGEERGRLNSDSEQRHRRKWRLLCMSSGERRLGELIEEEGRGETVSSGQEARCIDIPVDSPRSIQGVVEQLNGAPNTAAVVEEIERLTRRHYGHAGPVFVEALIETVKTNGRAEFEQWLEQWCDAFVSDLALPQDADPIIRRVAYVFALIAAAGMLAIAAGVLPLEQARVIQGCKDCFNDWLKDRGSVTKTAAQRAVLVSLRDFISTNRLQFIDLDKHMHERREVGKVIGYRKKVQGEIYYMLTSEAWNEVNRKAKRGNLFKQLSEVGLIRTGEDGRHQYKLKFTDATGPIQERVYAVSSRIDAIDDAGNLTSDASDDLPAKPADGGAARLRAMDPQLARATAKKHIDVLIGLDRPEYVI